MARQVEPEEGGAERRREERIPARIEVRFRESEQVARAIKAYSLNLSVGGLCLRTQKVYAIGHEMTLDMDVAGQSYSLRAIVAWVRKGTTGVRFVDVSETDRVRLSQMVAALKT